MFSDQVPNARGRPVCKECLGETLQDQESGEDVCTSCGAVAESPDWSPLVSISRPAIERSQSRSSLAPIIHDDLEIPTLVGGRDVDAKGRRLDKNYELRQLRRLGSIVSWDSKRKRNAKVSTEIRRVTEALGFGNPVMVRAYQVYSKSFDSKAARVTSVSAAAAAAVCIACLQLDVPRPPDKVVALKANVDEKRLRHHYKVLARRTSTNGVPNPAIYVSSVAARASLNGTTERKALEILAKTKGSKDLIGKRPISIAAGALYLASVEARDQTTQMRLASAARVSPITVRKCSGAIARILQENPRRYRHIENT